jgi:lipopolysaccharide/colanic/teichoic acid biosynthesis glycosyltransferase
LLITTAPILALAMLAIRLSSPGSALFTQRRAGLGGRAFTIYKLRTMYEDSEQRQAALRAASEQDGPAFKIKNDPRITFVGRFLRKSCLDELPQLWNVIRGEMSIVGPRPLPIGESNACQNWEKRRLDVTPGLTCIWQVRGSLRVSFTEWMRMDIRYIRGRSILRDLQLMFQTAIAVVCHRASH